MKKLLSFLLALTLLLLAACGQSSPGAAPDSSDPPAAAAEAPRESEPDETPQEPEPAEAPQEESESDVPPETFSPTAAAAETVLVDEKDVKITATALSYTDYAVEVRLTLENNTDRALTFFCGTQSDYHFASVNGYMFSGIYMNTDISAGKKSNETLSFSADELMLMGISDIADIELYFCLTDDSRDTYLQAGPCRLETPLAAGYDYTADTYRAALDNPGVLAALDLDMVCLSDETAFDQAGVRVVSQAMVRNSDGEPALLLELESSADQLLRAYIGNITVNGLTLSSGTWTSEVIAPGTRRVIAVNLGNVLDQYSAQLFGISEVGLVSCTVSLENADRDALCEPQAVTLRVPGAADGYDVSGDEVYHENGIRLVSVGVAPDPSDYSDDLHILLLAENESAETMYAGIGFDSLSVNGYMMDFISYSKEITPGGSAVLDISMYHSGLEESGISAPADITEVGLTLELRDRDYRTLAEPELTFAVRPAQN